MVEAEEDREETGARLYIWILRGDFVFTTLGDNLLYVRVSNYSIDPFLGRL